MSSNYPVPRASFSVTLKTVIIFSLIPLFYLYTFSLVTTYFLSRDNIIFSIFLPTYYSLCFLWTRPKHLSLDFLIFYFQTYRNEYVVFPLMYSFLIPFNRVTSTEKYSIFILATSSSILPWFIDRKSSVDRQLSHKLTLSIFRYPFIAVETLFSIHPICLHYTLFFTSNLR